MFQVRWKTSYTACILIHTWAIKVSLNYFTHLPRLCPPMILPLFLHPPIHPQLSQWNEPRSAHQIFSQVCVGGAGGGQPTPAQTSRPRAGGPGTPKNGLSHTKLFFRSLPPTTDRTDWLKMECGIGQDYADWILIFTRNSSSACLTVPKIESLCDINMVNQIWV